MKMGDRFYESQKLVKKPRRLKKDIIAEINKSLGKNISGLDKCTVATLDELLGAIK
jgi:hypothetical protein